MTTISHLVRPHLFSDELSYTLAPDALVFVHRGKTTEIPYSDITSVRLLSYANYGGVQYQCTVKTRSHGTLKIRSHHYRSLGNFEDRTETYTPLIRELCQRVHARNPDAQFFKGSGWIQTLWLIVLFICIGGWIILAITLFDGAAIDESLGFIGILIVATFLSVRWTMRSKPDLFDPSDPPFTQLD